MINNQDYLSNPADLADFNVVSEHQFIEYTLEWTKQISGNEMSWKVFADKDSSIEQMLVQVYFNDATIQSLLSCVGVKHIHARFAIVHDYYPYKIKLPTFTMILYATDQLGQRCSAYHIGRPQYHDNITVSPSMPSHEIGNFISSRLAQKWISEWKIVCDANPKSPELLSKLFLTNYGYLTGYNYVLSDFMYSLFPPETQKECYDVVILPVIHKHVADHLNAQPTLKRTFGLVLAGVPFNAKDIAGDEEVNSFYDLSLPTPPSNGTY
ncbi:hypothetical protein OQX63_14195 [Pedobacter sp. PF22-3]|uniref:hypothetical protein n=1 Tax=Pedobacter sp. PF22-3 TaxID=2994467 RepID=UPI002247EDAA|nr:hypothetical protein [Pedobacter sp. PF22-3]MCX2494633.1 hypothetical protein [Pedobacter sp. PF22-3]